jgi:hypothetical protein
MFTERELAEWNEKFLDVLDVTAYLPEVKLGWRLKGDRLQAPQPPTATLKDKEREVQRLLDKVAQGMGYDNIGTAISYAEEDSVPEYAVEARKLRAWRSAVWAKFYEQVAACGGDASVLDLSTLPTLAA